jgi:hypothetical protein
MVISFAAEDEGMDEIGIVDAIAAVRSELRRAVEAQSDDDIQFPIAGVQLEFQVGITGGGHGGAKVGIHVLELSAGGKYEKESIHKVVLSLGAPVDSAGRTIKVTRLSPDKP